MSRINSSQDAEGRSQPSANQKSRSLTHGGCANASNPPNINFYSNVNITKQQSSEYKDVAEEPRRPQPHGGARFVSKLKSSNDIKKVLSQFLEEEKEEFVSKLGGRTGLSIAIGECQTNALNSNPATNVPSPMFQYGFDGYKVRSTTGLAEAAKFLPARNINVAYESGRTTNFGNIAEF